MAKVLIIDDEISILELLDRLFSQLGHQVALAPSAQDGLFQAENNEFDLIFSDVRLPDGDGLDLLPQLIESPGKPEVVIMTGYGEPDGAEVAITQGAWDYLEKPPSLNRIKLVAKRALQYHQSKKTKKVLNLKRDGLVGESPTFKACLDALAEAANTESPVLITGPTGTGKERFARLLHNNSSRSSGSFVVADCGSIPEKLVESYFFGHVRGAFTGAERNTMGLVKQAHGGTLFLDEVGELPLDMQRSLLRVLQERTFRPVGSDKEMSSDFRLVAATNQELEDMVDQGAFRQDLLYRLKGFELRLPTLAERKGDIKLIAEYHLDQLRTRYKTLAKSMAADFVELLMGHDWPGNVRELLNLMDTVFYMAGDATTLFSKHLPVEFRARSARRAVKGYEPENEAVPEMTLSPFREHRAKSVDIIEKEYIENLAIQSKGDLASAMRISGLGKTRLYNLLKKHGISLKK